MEIVLIVLIVFGISLLLSIYQLVRLGPSLRAAASVVISAILFIIVLFVYLDMTDFREKFEDSEKLFLLQEADQQFVAGFSGQLTGGEAPTFLDAGSLAKKQVEYDTKDTDAFVGAHYKVFVVRPTIFESIARDIDYEDTSFTPAEFQRILDSDSPISTFAELYLKKLGLNSADSALKDQLMVDLREQTEDDAGMRGFIFAKLFFAGNEGDSNFLIRAISSGNVEVFEETALFMLFHYTPPILLEQVAQFEEINESTGQS